jgi:hypothetical protein
MFPTIVKIGRLLFVLCAGATVLMGCPLYSNDCSERDDCASGFYCDPYSLRCEAAPQPAGCSRPDQCGIGETCTPDFICRPGSCDYHGCVHGYRCGVEDSVHTCLSVSEDAGADASSEPADAAVDASVGATDAGDGGISSDASVDAAP